MGFWQPSCKVSGYWLCLLECIGFRDNRSFQDTLALLATLNIRLVAVAYLLDPDTSESGEIVLISIRANALQVARDLN
jgi:hypothetical protein